MDVAGSLSTMSKIALRNNDFHLGILDAGVFGVLSETVTSDFSL